MEKIKIGISIGDMNGIGLEVILKTLAEKRIREFCTPIIYGSSKVVSYHKNIVDFDFQFYPLRSSDKAKNDKVNVLSCWNENVNITLGKVSESGGKYAQMSLSAMVKDLKEGLIDAIVTAPINKKAMQSAGFKYSGHTEYFTEEFETKESLMLMVSENLRVGLVTNHLPIKDVSKAITKEKIISKLKIMNRTLKVDFDIERPVIAVLSLNPHAGDEGVLGNEEEKIIRPAVIESKKADITVMGPFPADSFFGMGEFKKYDGILAMYHDQGLGPFKALSGEKGVNYTAGLPFVRTSPIHGTAFNIAGENKADHTSFRNALFLAIDILKTRRSYLAMHKNPLKKKELSTDAENNATD